MASSKTTNPRKLALQKINKEKKAQRAEKRKAEIAKKPSKVHEQKEIEPVTREMTIYLHKYLYKESFKKRAPKAIKTIRFIAMKTMKTHTVKFDMGLNQFLWSQGIRSVAHRVRVRMARMQEEGEEGRFYTLVSYVPVATFKGLTTKVVEDAE
ncbi:60S ribosomal protein L31 [Entamoeba marina]